MEMAKEKRELGFGHMGNGLVVWDRLHQEHGDYQRIAHIRADRSVKYHVADLDQEYKNEIEEQAAMNDSQISVTQDQKVFLTRPNITS